MKVSERLTACLKKNQFQIYLQKKNPLIIAMVGIKNLVLFVRLFLYFLEVIPDAERVELPADIHEVQESETIEHADC